MFNKLLKKLKEKKINKAKDKHALEFLQKKGVVAVHIGNKISEGKDTGKLSLKVYVKKKKKEGNIAEEDFIPPIIDGVDTDVDEMEMPKAYLPDRETYRPLKGGCEISVKDVNFVGTLGNIYYRTKVTTDNGWAEYIPKWILPDSWKTHFKITTEVEILGGTNLHVVADGLESPIGRTIVQPGVNGGVIGEIIDYEPLGKLLLNEIDEALIKIRNSDVDLKIIESGQLIGVEEPYIGMKVKKRGRTTGFTTGIIVDKGLVINIDFGDGLILPFKGLIAIQGDGIRFSAPGDSGSAILDEKNNFVARLNSGNGTLSFGIPASKILKRFRVGIDNINNQKEITTI